MAKLFYTLEEAAQRLSKSESEVKRLVESGQLQEFRDRDRLMFKVEQVDLLASGGEDDMIPLADSGGFEDITLASDSGSGIDLESPKEQSGISIFEADELEQADASAQTRITETATTEFAVDSGGSGSGLLDMTREADDTSLGADLLGDVYGGGEEGGRGALFESTGAEAETTAAPVPMMLAAEPYDHMSSCVFGGMALGVVAMIGFMLFLVVAGLIGGASPVLDLVSSNFMVWGLAVPAGAVVGGAILGAVAGMATK